MSIGNAAVRQAIERGIRGLNSLQDSDGSFAVKPSVGRPPKYALDPIFSTASVLVQAGRFLSNATREAAIHYVLKRRNPDGLWRWEGCPSDSDDTAQCMSALTGAGVLDPSEALRLRQFWTAPSGPFRTWPEGFGNEKLPFDPVVNCNVLFCLTSSGNAVFEGEKHAVSDLVVRAIQSSMRYSEYYHSLTTLLDAAVRADLEPNVLRAIIDCLRPEEFNPQQTAEFLAASPYGAPQLLHRLLDAQKQDGTFPGALWFFDPRGGFYCDAYATAVSLRALHRVLAI